MPFEWLHPKVGSRPSRLTDRADVYRRELKERAALLYRLHYTAAQAKERIAANVRWDYEIGPFASPVAASEVGALVDQVYSRHGVGAGPLTV